MLTRVKSIGRQKAHGPLVYATQSAVFVSLCEFSILKLVSSMTEIRLNPVLLILPAALVGGISYLWLRRKEKQLSDGTRRLIWANISFMLAVMVLIWI